MMKKSVPNRPLRAAIALALGLALTTGILSGCSKAPSNPNSGSAGSNSSGQVSGDDFEAKVGAWKPDLKTITIRVSNAAGGTADLKYRLVAKNIQDTTGTTAVVQNITGSNGFLMATDLLSYDPSPSELMVGTEALFAVAPLFNADINVSLDDYEILFGSPSSSPSVLAVPSTLGVKTWEEFVSYAANNRIIMSSSAPGGMTHIQGTALMGSAGISFDSVTDSGANKNILACLNGDANCVLANTSALHDYVESGQMIPLVQFNKTTFDDPTWGLDPIPSVAEVGYPDIAVEPCTILCCRKGADPVGVEAMRRIILDYPSSEQGIAEMAELGLNSNEISGEEAYQRLTAEIDTFKMIKDKFY